MNRHCVAETEEVIKTWPCPKELLLVKKLVKALMSPVAQASYKSLSYSPVQHYHYYYAVSLGYKQIMGRPSFRWDCLPSTLFQQGISGCLTANQTNGSPGYLELFAQDSCCPRSQEGRRHSLTQNRKKQLIIMAIQRGSSKSQTVGTHRETDTSGQTPIR